MKKLMISLGVCLLLVQGIMAQLKVNELGNVGVKVPGDTILSTLSIGTVGLNEAAVSVVHSKEFGVNSKSIESNADWTYGLYGRAYFFKDRHIGVCGVANNATPFNKYRAIGVLGVAGNATSGYNYGVYGNLQGSQNGAGIVGSVNSLDVSMLWGQYAGYFAGNVKVTGVLTVGTQTYLSDKRYKKNIKELIQTDALEGILAMNPIEYNLQQPQLSSVGDSVSTRSAQLYYDEKSELYQKKKFGLIAQELQSVYPNLVYSDDSGYLSVDYVSIIPLLIKSIQELHAELETIKGTGGVKSKSMSSSVSDNIETMAAALYQNVPNPFNENTSIAFVLPETVQTAVLYLYDMNGSQIDKFTLSERGTSSITITGGRLSAGIYLYALITDGKVIDTKRMILTK